MSISILKNWNLLICFFILNVLLCSSKEAQFCERDNNPTNSYPLESQLTDLGLEYSNDTTELKNIIDNAIESSSKEDIYRMSHLYYLKFLFHYHEPNSNSNKTNDLVNMIVSNDFLYPCGHSRRIIHWKVQQLKRENNHGDIINMLTNIESKRNDISHKFIYAQLARTYYHTEQYEEAIEYYIYLLKFDEKTFMGKASMNNNLALAYSHLEVNDLALHYFAKAKEYLIKAENELKNQKKDMDYFYFFQKVVDNNILERDTNVDSKVLIENLEEQIALGKKVGIKIQFSPHADIARLALKFGDKKRAEKYMAFLDSIIAVEDLVPENRIIYKKLKFTQTLNVNRVTSNVNILFEDLISDIKKEYHRKQIIYQKSPSAVKSWNIKRLFEKEKSLLQERKSNQQLELSLIITFIIVLFISIGFLYQRRIKLKIEEKNVIIEKALDNSKVLIKEVHHRVKNNLEMVSSIAFLEHQKNEIEFDYENFENKIISLSLIHQMLYSTENLSQVRLDLYISELIENLERTILSNASFNLELKPINLSLEFAISFGLLVNELITNTSKHCKPKNNEEILIDISIDQDENTWGFTYKDNGYNEINSDNVQAHLGTELIDVLIYKLRGTKTITWTDGYKIVILFEQIKLL